MKWDVVFQPDNLLLYGEGFITTVSLLFFSLLAGGVLALFMAIALTERWGWLRRLVGAYTYVFRGTPLLIQIYLIYYGLGQLEWIQARWDEVWPWTHFNCGSSFVKWGCYGSNCSKRIVINYNSVS